MQKALKAAPLLALVAGLAYANWSARSVEAFDYPVANVARPVFPTGVASAFTPSPAPLPSPSPSPSPPPASNPVASAPVSAAPAQQPSHPTVNWLRSEDGAISVYVGIYNDPTGQAPVPHGYAVLDLAMRDVPWYFDGHNPGVFTPLLYQHVGSMLDYWDGGGKLHKFRIIAIRSWQRLAGEPPPVSGAVVAQFQTCRTLDGSVDWIYDAVAA